MCELKKVLPVFDLTRLQVRDPYRTSAVDGSQPYSDSLAQHDLSS
nr:hypothetical protein JVH1_4246 [Rhodococcus sp. JVH1]